MVKHRFLSFLRRQDSIVEMIVYVVLFFVVVASAFVIYPMIFQSTTEVRIGVSRFEARLAINDIDRLNGLSGITELKYDEAMLKIYPSVDRWPVFMMDMKFPIDILWINSNKQVVYMVKNAQVSDGKSFMIHKTKIPAKYILELPAGSIQERRIALDSVVIFSTDESKVE